MAAETGMGALVRGVTRMPYIHVAIALSCGLRRICAAACHFKELARRILKA